MTTTIPAGGTQEYLPDRYDRLRNVAEILASDPNVENADNPLANGEALSVFIGELAERRLLDGLTEHEADTVAMLITLDFLKGPKQIAGRIQSWLHGKRFGRDEEEQENPYAVCAVLAEVLSVYLGGFAGVEFMEARDQR